MKAPNIDMSSRPRIESNTITLLDLEASQTNWNVADSSLRPLPVLHAPLDRQCVVYVGDASPSVVAARISECLKKRSIVVEYNDEGATARAMTSDRVRFAIHLHSGGSSGGNNDHCHGIIVECTRIRGCPRSFHRTCRAVLNAARGDSDGMEYSEARSPYLTLVSDDDDEEEEECKPSADLDPASSSSPQESAAVLGIEIAWSLLKKDRLDANLLGMESVVCLTDVKVSGKATALIAAKVVLLGALSHDMPHQEQEQEEDQRFVDIHHFVISLVRDRKMTGNALIEDDSDEEDDDIHEFGNSGGGKHLEEIDYLSSMRNLALKALSNALEVATMLGTTPPSPTSTTTHFQQQSFLKRALQHLVEHQNIIPSLIDEISLTVLPDRLAWNAHDAAIAARILRFVFQNSVEASERANACNALAVLDKAALVGRSRHVVLEQESEEAIRYLGD